MIKFLSEGRPYEAPSVEVGNFPVEEQVLCSSYSTPEVVEVEGDFYWE